MKLWHGAAWRRQEPPLAPTALAVKGPKLVGLVSRLKRIEDDQLARIRCVMFVTVDEHRGVVIRADTTALPWCDGAIYLATPSPSSGLLIPAQVIPAAPLDLFERSLRRALCEPPGDVAVVPQWSLAVALASSRPLTRALLRVLVG
ncbi:MAG: hypothetical protein ACR2RL_05250 [Gammaproteobacteria bacterium]